LGDGGHGRRHAVHRRQHGRSLADYHLLGLDHRPLGIAILVLVVIRLVNRLINPAPPLPDHMPSCSARRRGIAYRL